MEVLKDDYENIAMFEADSFIGKKARARRKAKRSAKKEARSSGKSRKESRRIGRAASQVVKGTQLRAKALKKGGSRAKRLLKRAGKVEARKGRTIAGNVIRKVGKAASFLPLLPLMPVMGAALKKKGFPVPKKVHDRAQAFYNNIVRKNGNTYDLPEVEGDNFAPLAIIPPIIAFVKNILNKKKAQKAGEPVELTPIEELVGSGAEKVIQKVDRETQGQGVDISEDFPESNSKDFTSDDSGGSFGDTKPALNLKSPMVMVAILGVVVLLIVLVKK